MKPSGQGLRQNWRKGRKLAVPFPYSPPDGYGGKIFHIGAMTSIANLVGREGEGVAPPLRTPGHPSPGVLLLRGGYCIILIKIACKTALSQPQTCK
jgi:hypothetical protein